MGPNVVSELSKSSACTDDDDSEHVVTYIVLHTQCVNTYVHCM